MKRIKKIICLGLGVALLISFGSFSNSGPNTKELSLKGLQASVISNPADHTMREALFDYMDPKVHHLLKEKEYKNIWIIGDPDRTGVVSKYEKRDKLFNWQRPTASIHGEDLYIKVFPGREYVKHYATLIGTYFAIQHKDAKHVHYVLPDEAVAWKALTSSNLKEVPKGDVAILGYGLEQLIGEKEVHWEGKGNFSWMKKQIGDKTVVFIGGRHSYWGDIAGRIVSLLAKQGFSQVIYVGKVGGMNGSGIPNQTLATGDTSFVDGETIRWKNVFDFAQGDKQVVFGEHYTIPSVMNETKEWLEKNKNYAFVDNEIGFMAKAAQSEGIQFSYLHIISDNLNGGFEEDLTNERGDAAKAHRTKILQKAKNLIEESLVKKEVAMEEKPAFLYKVLSMDDWAKSGETVHLPSMDADFIHLSTEDQLDRIIEKYWADVSEYVVLKIETAKLSGKLVLEANPGGTNKYYHLYNGSIPKSAIVESKVKKI